MPPIPGDVVNVTNYGARGDARITTAAIASNGMVISIPDLSADDVGRQVQIFYGGPQTVGTNHEGYVGWVQSADGTNATLSWPTSNTLAAATCVIGTDNTPALRAAAAAAGPNGAIYVPTGVYLATTPALTNQLAECRNCTSPEWGVNDNGRSAALWLLQGTKLRILGDGPTNSVLVACSVWRKAAAPTVLQPNYEAPYRGTLIAMGSPFNLDDYLIVENLGLKGGLFIPDAAQAEEAVSGTGWGGFNWALIAKPYLQVGGYTPAGTIPVLSVSNCILQNFYSECVATGVEATNAHLTVANCRFENIGGGSINYSRTQFIHDTTFSNTLFAAELFHASMDGESIWSNVTTYCKATLALTGARTNQDIGSMLMTRCSFYTNGILLAGFKNLTISNCTFASGAQFVNVFGPGGQLTVAAGGDWNRNITLVSNVFLGLATPGIKMDGISAAGMENYVVGMNVVGNLYISLNPSSATSSLIEIGGASVGAYFTNLVVSGNSCPNTHILNDYAGSLRWTYADISTNNVCIYRKSGDNATRDFNYGFGGGRLEVQCRDTNNTYTLSTEAPDKVADGALRFLRSVSLGGYFKSFNVTGVTPEEVIPADASVSYRWSTNTTTWVKQ